ncbi:MAG: prenyltransferase/squalene oxidase repeat-containing protein [Phycisphaeraceae bacterium]
MSLRSALAILLLFVVALPAAAQDNPAGKTADFQEITDELNESVKKGLAYLAKQQNKDGSFDADRYGGSHVGVTAICCLAFLANGELPGRGEYGHVVQKGLDYILANAQESGLIASENVSHGPMYGHGFATLFLGEVYGMTDDDDVRDALVKAVRLIVKSQNREGGWRYHPVPYEADLSVTICQVKALRSARQGGIDVPKETIDNAIQYVKDCQNSYDGGFRYMVGGGSSAFPRSAAGVASLYYAGVYRDDAINDGLKYLKERIKSGEDRGGHEIYGHYYCSQAMFIAGGEHWADYYPRIRDRMIDDQSTDGSWDSAHGGDYATGMSLIILQMPYRLLPIFQR